jgi:predicted AlkP superfamily phosphohydrolase/phosphomutase
MSVLAANAPRGCRAPRGRPVWLLVVAAALVALSSAATTGSTVPTESERLRVTLIGIDGATWRVLDPLLARGELPNVARLIANGVRAPLRSRIPLYSAAVWTTMATGVRRERHGITDFQMPDGHLSASVHRRVPALWTLASDAGLHSAVIGWWVTYPAEAIKGVIISERALRTRDEDMRSLAGDLPRRELPRLLHPSNVAELVTDLLADLSNEAPEDDERAMVMRTMRAEDAAVVRLLGRLRERMNPFDLEMILLRGVDPISHYFWKFFEPAAAAYGDADRPSSEEVSRYNSAIEDHYRYVDGLLGEAARSEPDRVVMLLSDHGFEAGHQPFRGGVLSGKHETKAALYGIFLASGGPIRRGELAESVTILDIAPTVLHLLGLPVAESLEGRVLVDIFEPQWTAGHLVKTVPTYGCPPVALSPQALSAGPQSPVDEELREQLRALGYIE